MTPATRLQRQGERAAPSSSDFRVIAAVGVDEYRETIPFVVRKGDAVLEVGCHFGTTTVDLHAAARCDPSNDDAGADTKAGASASADTIGTADTAVERTTADSTSGSLGGGAGGDAGAGGGGCVGVDIGRSIIAGARLRYPHVPFAVADAWHTAELARLRALIHSPTRLPLEAQSTAAADAAPVSEAAAAGLEGRRFDVVYVDVGGLSGSDGLLEALALIDALGRALEPRAIVVKSQCVRRLASRLVPFTRVQTAAWAEIRASRLSRLQGI
jgi:hypothetical protein